MFSTADQGKRLFGFYQRRRNARRNVLVLSLLTRKKNRRDPICFFITALCSSSRAMRANFPAGFKVERDAVISAETKRPNNHWRYLWSGITQLSFALLVRIALHVIHSIIRRFVYFNRPNHRGNNFTIAPPHGVFRAVDSPVNVLTILVQFLTGRC